MTSLPSSTMRCVAERGLFGEGNIAYTSAMSVADFSKTEDAGAELNEGYNERRPKEPEAKNTGCLDLTGPGGG